MGAIPLPALGVKPPEQQPNALEQYARIMQLQQQQKLIPGQLQQQQQQIQAGQLENQQRQQQLKNVQVAPDVLKEWYQGGKDINQLPQLVAKHGGTIDLANSLIKQQQDVENLTKDQRANQLATNDALMGHIDAMKGIDDPVKRAQTSQSQAQRIIQSGLDKNLDPQSQQLVQAVAAGQHVPTDDELNIFEKGLTVHSVAIKDAQTASETAKNTAQAGMDTANTAKIQAELNFYKKQGLAPGVPLDAQEAADWMQKNPGKGPAEFMKMKAALVPQMNFNLNNAVPKGEGGQPSAMAQAVAAGQMKWGDVISPRTPMAVKEAFAKEVKTINPNFNSGDFTIEQKVKQSFTSGKVSDELNAYNTAIAHADLLQKAADAMNNGNIRALNSLGNQLGVQFGSDKKTNFDIIRNAYTAETTKALTSGHITDTELGKQGGTMPDNASPAQFAGAVNAYKALMASKKQQRVDQFNQGTQAKPNFGNQPEAPKGMIQARDQQGKLHQAPAGTALPAGWKLEQ